MDYCPDCKRLTVAYDPRYDAKVCYRKDCGYMDPKPQAWGIPKEVMEALSGNGLRDGKIGVAVKR